MFSERLQILVSPEQKSQLEAKAADQGKSVGGVVREAIEAHYGRLPRAQRIAAVEAIKSMHAELPEDPAEVDRMIDEGRLDEALQGLEPDTSE